MIAESTIAQVSDRSILSEIASSYFPLKKKGNQFWGCCPFHHERSPSFAINDDKGLWKCWGCGKSGNVFGFIMEIERVSFPESVSLLASRLGIEVEQAKSGAADNKRRLILDSLEKASESFFRCLVSKVGEPARMALKARGFDRRMCEIWGVGYASEFMDIGVGMEEQIAAGLCYENGSPRFKNRITFGIRNESGVLLGFSGRALDNHPAKYLNSPETLVFNKGRLLYAMDRARRPIIDSGEAIVVEGQVDAITCHKAGLTTVVAPLGTGFTAVHGQMLKRLCNRVVLAFDGDNAGQEAARKAYAGLVGLGIEVRYAVMPHKVDPDGFIRGGGDFRKMVDEAELYPVALAKSLPMNTIEEKEEALDRVGYALSCMEDGISRDSLATDLSRVLGVKPSVLKKRAAMGGGHINIPTMDGGGISETERQLIAHLLQCGKDLARPYDWKMVVSQYGHICAIMDSDYEAGNPSSIAPIIAKLGDRANGVLTTHCEEVHDIDVKSIYKSMVESSLKKMRGDGSKMDDMLPLLATLKSL